MPESETSVDSIPITVNGTEILARRGELLIDAAERGGVYIPRFCYHPRMSPVGMCRMCIVEVDTGRGPALQPSCMLECTPGMVVDTESPVTKKAQDGVLEFLLVNHPLDCPVCDKGGECPLQDQTMAYGPGESRFVEEKRHFEKPIPISDLVLLDRERCILCDRCTRFAKEVAGDPLIHFIHRGNRTEVNTFPDDPFSSYFSGNTVQICPVGALTATSYRFKARPWDLEATEATCQTCSVGCRVSIESSRNEVLRYLGVDVDPVNWGWLCDKGRFAFEAVSSEDRLREPVVRSADGQRFEAVSWSEALGRAASVLRETVTSGGREKIGVIGGARLTNESAYAWSKLVKGVIGTDNVDCQLGDGLPADLVLGLPPATIDEAFAPGSTVVVLGPDLKDELPVLYLRLRHAVEHDGVSVVELSSRATSVTPLASVSLRPRPGEMGDLCRVLAGSRPIGDSREVERIDTEELAKASAALRRERVTVLLGRPSVAEAASVVTDAAAALSEIPGVRFLSALRRGNVHGALDAGLAPGMLPGRMRLEEGRAHLAGVWPGVTSGGGLDTEGMLRAAAAGELSVLVLLGADPLGDFPDRTLASAALAAVPTVIAVDQFVTGSVAHASIVLPVAGFGEVDGTTTNLERRVSVQHARVTAPGTARPDWIIATDLAWQLGHDLGFDSVAGIRAEMAKVAPSWAGVTEELLAERGADGVVLPLPAHPAETDPADTDTADTDTADPADTGSDADTATISLGKAEDTTPSGPAVLSFVAPDEPPPPVKNDSYSLRLIVSRKLYDDGVVVQKSPHLASLPPGTDLAVNPYEFDRVGVAPGTVVYLTSSRTTVQVALRPDAGVPRGAAAMFGNQESLRASELLDLSSPVCEVRIDTEEPR